MPASRNAVGLEQYAAAEGAVRAALGRGDVEELRGRAHLEYGAGRCDPTRVALGWVDMPAGRRLAALTAVAAAGALPVRHRGVAARTLSGLMGVDVDVDALGRAWSQLSSTPLPAAARLETWEATLEQAEFDARLFWVQGARGTGCARYPEQPHVAWLFARLMALELSDVPARQNPLLAFLAGGVVP
jgi:hypothetical protein